MAKSKGIVFYEGPSLLDGSLIVGIATFSTSNKKTGQMIGTWILRQDKSPTAIIYGGEDASICGDCKHRGVAGRQRSCYVTVHQAPLGIWKAYKRGRYDIMLPGDIPTWSKDKLVRMGSYGDPAAIPTAVWEQILFSSKGYTGYTHAWKYCDPALKNFCMASVDSEAEYLEAKLMGWRTFRVRQSTDILLPGEFQCPASIEESNRLDCASCLACSGLREGNLTVKSGSPSIIVHGRKATITAFGKNLKSDHVLV